MCNASAVTYPLLSNHPVDSFQKIVLQFEQLCIVQKYYVLSKKEGRLCALLGIVIYYIINQLDLTSDYLQYVSKKQLH